MTKLVISQQNIRHERRRWLKSLIKQGILTGTKAEAKKKVLKIAKQLDVLKDFSNEKKAGKAMQCVLKVLVKNLPWPALYFYGAAVDNKHRVFSNFYQVDIQIEKTDMLAIATAINPSLFEFDTMDTAWYFRSSEQLFMFLKAICMSDASTAGKIYQSKTPSAAKKLGRQVAPFNVALWDEKSSECMQHAVLCKFRHCKKAQEVLLATGNRVLVEASATDCKWGIGLSKSKALNGALWRGQNLLGEALYITRAKLRSSSE